MDAKRLYSEIFGCMLDRANDLTLSEGYESFGAFPSHPRIKREEERVIVTAKKKGEPMRLFYVAVEESPGDPLLEILEAADELAIDVGETPEE